MVKRWEERARDIRRHGDRGSRIGLLLLLAGAALLIIAIVGAIVVNV